MKVFIKGKGQVNLTNNDYIAEGGQGKIFGKGNLVYKIYHDSAKMIPESKIAELQTLTFPNIVKPEDLLLDSKNKVIGYTMKYLPDSHPLCKVFTKAFRQREGITEKNILEMVQRMQKTVAHCHDNKILIVDLNEMNFLVSKKFDEVYFLDVDSYQTPHFPATALMESVRDRHIKGKFTQETDWFAFGIVSFQMFIGIHPYKGKHPSILDIDERMIKNISVLNNAVSIPAVCYPFTNIPKAYYEWYKAIFEDGKRCAPPTDLNTAIVLVTKVQKVTGSNSFDIAEISMFKSDIINFFYSSCHEVVITEKDVFLDGRESPISVKSTIGFTPKMNKPIAAYCKNGSIEIYDMIGQKVLHTCSGRNAMQYDNRIYIQSDQNILEVDCYEGKDIFVSTHSVANILEKATQMFDGVIIQNLLGSYYISLFPKTKHHQQFTVKELQGYAVIDAKFENGVLMVVGHKLGKYDRFVFRFDENWEYDVRIIQNISYSGLNFTVLENGICICITENELVEIFSNKRNSTAITSIDDSGIDSSMKLFHKGTKVMFAKGNKLHSMTMRKK
jgi:serine/threonine protein kinase